MRKIVLIISCHFIILNSFGQIKWENLDSLYQPLPSSIHIFKSTDSLDGKPNVMYYAIADLKNKNLKFTTDTLIKDD